MTRSLALAALSAGLFPAIFLAGCASPQRAMTPPGQSAAPAADNPEVHRGLLTNQKSSPDSGQSPGGDGLGGGRGPGGY